MASGLVAGGISRHLWLSQRDPGAGQGEQSWQTETDTEKSPVSEVAGICTDSIS